MNTPRLFLPLAATLLLLFGACKKPAPSGTNQAPTASTATAAKKTTGVLPEKAVEEVTNPGDKAVYSGPVGSVRGVVRATGDAPVKLDELIKKIPVGKCFEAHKRYQHVFREGEERALADVLVAVTEYKGHLAAPKEPVRVDAKDCAYDRRTIGLTYGQSIEIFNIGKDTHTPDLVGARTQALLVAMPGGKPVRLTAPKPGYYQLVDRSHEHIFADVYVLAYSTLDVTGLDGTFEIKGLPVGKVKVSAMLPITNQTVSKEVEIQEGKATELVFEMPFDAKAFAEAAKKKSDTQEK